MGLVSRAYDFVNGTIADAEEIDVELNTLFNELNGNLDVSNFKPAAGILGSMLASAPNGIPETKLNTNSVSTSKIVDLSVTGVKIANATIPGTKLIWTSYTKTFSGSDYVDVIGQSILDTQFTPNLPIIAPGNLPLCVYADIPTGNDNRFTLCLHADATAHKWRVRITGTWGDNFGNYNTLLSGTSIVAIFLSL